MGFTIRFTSLALFRCQWGNRTIVESVRSFGKKSRSYCKLQLIGCEQTQADSSTTTNSIKFGHTLTCSLAHWNNTPLHQDSIEIGRQISDENFAWSNSTKPRRGEESSGPSLRSESSSATCSCDSPRRRICSRSSALRKARSLFFSRWCIGGLRKDDDLTESCDLPTSAAQRTLAAFKRVH